MIDKMRSLDFQSPETCVRASIKPSLDPYRPCNKVKSLKNIYNLKKSIRITQQVHLQDQVRVMKRMESITKSTQRISRDRLPLKMDGPKPIKKVTRANHEKNALSQTI
jgi:hypothetical protein